MNLPTTKLSDQFGRKKIFAVGMIGQALVFTTLMLSPWRFLAYIAMAFEGIFSPAINLTGYVFMCEFLTEKWQG